jgi:hypothetical protein
VNFFNIAQALAKAGYCVHVAEWLGYISKEVSEALETDIKQTGASLAGLIRSLGTQEQSEPK